MKYGQPLAFNRTFKLLLSSNRKPLENNARLCTDNNKLIKKYIQVKTCLYDDRLEIKNQSGSTILNVPFTKITSVKFAGLGAVLNVDDRSYLVTLVDNSTKAVLIGGLATYLSSDRLKSIKVWKNILKQNGVNVKSNLFVR